MDGMLTEWKWQDKDNEIFSEPLHADARQCSRLNGQMMGGSQQTQPTKYNLLSRSVIHLLHSDQFVLINPHKGTVSETKAPEEQWTVVPPPPSTPLEPCLRLSTPLHLKCSPFQHIVAPGCHRGSSVWAGQSEAHLKVGAKKKIPASASRVKYLRKEEKKNTQCSVSSCIQVTPSINSEINLDVAYKEPLQRKGGGEGRGGVQ